MGRPSAQRAFAAQMLLHAIMRRIVNVALAARRNGLGGSAPGALLHSQKEWLTLLLQESIIENLFEIKI